MAHCKIPITATGVSPAELLTDRKMKTKLPSHPNKLKLKWPNFMQEKDESHKTRSKIKHDKR